MKYGRPAMARLPTSALPPTPATCLSGSQFAVGCLGESNGTFFPFSGGFSRSLLSLSGPLNTCLTSNSIDRLQVRSKRWSHRVCPQRKLLWRQSPGVQRPRMATSVKSKRASDIGEETTLSNRNRSPKRTLGCPWLSALILSVF